MKLFRIQMAKLFRFFRIVTEGPNWHDDYGFDLGKIEFFGKM